MTATAAQPRFAGKPRSVRGFTLIEALAAGVILAAFASVITLGASRSLSAMGVSRDQQRAAMLLDTMLTRVDLYGPDRLLREGPRSGDFDPPFERFQWDIEVHVLTTPDLYEVAARVTWDAGGRLRSAEAHTRLYDPPGSRPDTIAWEDL